MKVTKYAFVLLLGGFFGTLTAAAGRPNPDSGMAGGPGGPTRPAQKQAIRTVIIDPGHGGFDSGTKGLYSKESNVCLAISLKLGKALQEEYPDVKQVFTRTTDMMPGGGATIAS